MGEQHIVANGRPGYVKRACDASLRRLQTDVIDLYQLHRADPEVPVEETWGAMAELVRPGKVRALGLCAVGARARGAGSGGAGCTTDTIRQLERVQQVFPVSAVQAELSVWSPEALDALLPWCEARGVGFLAAMPLGNGFLTGTLTPGRGLRAGRRTGPPPPLHGGDDGREPADRGRAAAGRAARHGADVTPAQVALAWVLAQGRHVVPVPGAKRERWAAQNAGAAELRLTARGSGGDRGAAAGAGVLGLTERVGDRRASARERRRSVGIGLRRSGTSWGASGV